MEDIKVNIDDKEIVVKVEEGADSLKVHLDGKVYDVKTSLKKEQKDYELSETSGLDKSGIVKANIPGIIFSIDIKPGDEVKKGQKLISLVAMKMENQVLAPISGKVKEVKVKKDDKVNKGDVMVIIE
jgi:biotin carboxyl carrier protein